MINLKNALWTNDNSAYHELAMLVDVFGLEDVLHALGEIATEQYMQRTKIVENLNRIVVIDGKEYVIS